MKMEPIVSPETSRIRTQTPENYPQETYYKISSAFFTYLIGCRSVVICLSGIADLKTDYVTVVFWLYIRENKMLIL